MALIMALIMGSLSTYLDGRTGSLLTFFCLRITQGLVADTAVEALSDLLSWLLLSLLALLVTRPWNAQTLGSRTMNLSSTYTWCISCGIIVSTWCRSEVVASWVWPTLAFALLVLRYKSEQYLPVSTAPDVQSSVIKRWIVPTTAALFCAVALFIKTTAWTQATSAVFLLAQIAVFGPLDALAAQETEPWTLEHVSEFVLQLGVRALPGISLWVAWEIFTTGYPLSSLPSGVLLGVLKAAQWCILLSITERAPWSIIATAGTFSSALAMIADLSYNLGRAVACLAASGIALNHTIDSLPAKGYKGRYALYCLIVIPLFVFWHARGFPTLPYSSMDSPQYPELPSYQTGSGEHPVEVLSRYYQNQLDLMLERQSRTYDAAVKEYTSRYHRDPPLGFEAWYNYAQRHKSLIIDDFDSIEDSLKSLRVEEPSKLKELVRAATRAAGSRMSACSTHDGKFDGSGCQWMGNEISELLADLDAGVSFPDTALALNSLDEPRVLPDSRRHDRVHWIDASRTSIWDRITENCDSAQSSKYVNTAHLQQSLLSLPFVHDAEEVKDVCVHPEYSSLHGFFQSPATFIYTQSAIPVLSPAKPSTFADVLYPPPFYMDMYDQGKYDEANDLAWEKKMSKLYWAGSTTGSHAKDDSWRNSHRQRFVARVNQLSNESATFLTETSPGNWQSFQSGEIFGQLYDVKFTAVIQCDSVRCSEESSYFKPGGREEANAGMHAKFIFDLDGNSFSGRFYTLLESQSVVFKQTIFKEWHDERLFPWVHYVPVSLDMGELPELMRYLALTTNGDKTAKSIADGGREWLRKALRKEDASIYMYRLLLELGRLMNDVSG